MSRIKMAHLSQRPRRNRKSKALRAMVAETHLRPQDFILPVFVMEGKDQKEPIPSMPGTYRYSVDQLLKLGKEIQNLKVPAVALFPYIEDNKKDSYAKESRNPDGLLQRIVKALKDRFPDICVITDVAMDPYSPDGHDGVVREGEILNDETLEILADMALCQAQAGADIVAPSDMMDGRIGFIRQALDESGYSQTGLLSYAAKYASAFYGPFRDALQSAPKSGDKKSYQMDPANSREALREVRLDLQQGADMVMVKPALPYLDIIQEVRKISTVPLAAYQVSGEYAMLKAATAKGWLDEKSVVLESLLSIKRAGADLILSYYALEAAQWLAEGES